jgi:isoleucyl-tRNA synthetase
MRMGIIGDWDNPYLTMDFAFEADIVRTLGRIARTRSPGQGFQAGALVHGLRFRPGRGRGGVRGQAVRGDRRGRSRRGSAALNGGLRRRSSRRPVVPIWTTTPWTLPGKPGGQPAPGARLRADCWTADGALLVAEALAEACAARFGLDDATGARALQGGGARAPAAAAPVPRAPGAGDSRRACHHRRRHRRGAHGAGPRPGRLRGRTALRLPWTTRSGQRRVPRGHAAVAGQHVFKANDAIMPSCCVRGALLHHEAYCTPTRTAGGTRRRSSSAPRRSGS